MPCIIYYNHIYNHTKLRSSQECRAIAYNQKALKGTYLLQGIFSEGAEAGGALRKYSISSWKMGCDSQLRDNV